MYDFEIVFSKNFNVFRIATENNITLTKHLLFMLLGDENNTFNTYDEASKVLSKLEAKLDEIF